MMEDFIHTAEHVVDTAHQSSVMSVKCEICGRNPALENIALHRVNPVGVMPAVWRCQDHLTLEQNAVIDPVVRDIVSVLEENKPPV